LPAFKAEAPIRVALPNGMVIFLQEDKDLPLIRGTAIDKDPADKAGPLRSSARPGAPAAKTERRRPR
jgi:hypothetical protein